MSEQKKRDFEKDGDLQTQMITYQFFYPRFEFSFKDWKDRFADKSPAASQLRSSIVAAPLDSNLEVPIVNSTNLTVPHNTVRQK